MFKDIFGNNPQTKILDFLADYPRFDYSITEIAQKAKVSRPTVYKIIKSLQEKNLVMKTREQGTSSLYQLNTKNSLVQVILRFDFEIASKVSEQEMKAPLKKRKSDLTKTKAVLS
ncbi:MAG: winged helix-turn-helix transcriptional regulator [Candidatus Thermoplasmatota archaeon]|nr:winged helix-turn-helix transcriptional regulator [Candidatus Thermoplasmatota archaeon]